jgi:hypothetical protein
VSNGSGATGWRLSSTQIAWTTALDFLVFGDVSTRWTIAGAVIVICSGPYVLYRERRIEPRHG